MWSTDLSAAPDRCVVILAMGRAPADCKIRPNHFYDVVCSACRIDDVWYGNTMNNIGPRIRAWAPLPEWVDTPGGPVPPELDRNKGVV